jgi:aspartate/methionine/tyrosine aminotransferase
LPSTRRISARVAAIAESATLAVDAKAKALKAAGEPVIGFGAGEPDFPTPALIVEAAIEPARRASTSTPPPPASPNSARPSPSRPSATRPTT